MIDWGASDSALADAKASAFLNLYCLNMSPASPQLDVSLPKGLPGLGPLHDLATVCADVEASQLAVNSFTAGARENFAVLTGLVPERARPGFAAVYAFCRVADDLADEHDGSDAARASALENLGRCELLTRRAFAQTTEPLPPLFVALRAAAGSYGLGVDPFLDLLEAFRQDQTVTRYRSLDGLIRYSEKSANPVGRIVLQLLAPESLSGSSGRNVLAASDALCTGLQLVNFWQDVRRDLLDRDRVYLPTETGITDRMLRSWTSETSASATARNQEAFERAMRPLCGAVAELFGRAQVLPELLPVDARPPIRLFLAGGEGTLRAVEECGYRTLWMRPTITRLTKVGLLCSAYLRAWTDPDLRAHHL
jgi:squalene synthase HpnC